MNVAHTNPMAQAAQTERMNICLKMTWKLSRVLLAFYLVTMALFGCQSETLTPFIDEQIASYKDLYDQSYGTDPLQRFDIHYPETVSGKPSEVLILLHGGSWSGGDKSFLTPSVEQLKKAQKNLTIVNANYRVTSKTGVRIGQQIEDIQQLVAFLKQKAVTYHLNEGAFVIGGVSAGGHLAMQYSYTHPTDGVRAVVGIVAPTDLTSKALREAGLEKSIVQLIGKSYEEAPLDFLQASPLNTMTPSAPRTILFYGGQDNIITPEQRVLTEAKLTLYGINHQVYFYPEQTHDFSAELLADKLINVFRGRY